MIELPFEGFAHPALRAFHAHFPLSTFPDGDAATVDRLHAEAEIARLEAMRLRVLAAVSTTTAETARLRQLGRDVDAHAEALFAQARSAADPLVFATA